jgi:hypothetical protein
LRPLDPRHSSLTHNVEKFLEHLLNPLLKKCYYLFNFTKSFKAKFSVQKGKFDIEKHETRCPDIKPLYPSVNVNKTVDFILDLLYTDQKSFYSREFDSEGKLLNPPTRIHFLKLLKYTSTKFSIFRTRIGVFQQLDGLSMGSCLSSIISNLLAS